MNVSSERNVNLIFFQCCMLQFIGLFKNKNKIRFSNSQYSRLNVIEMPNIIF